MRQLVYTMFITNNHAPFHLWWKENLVKYQKDLRGIIPSPQIFHFACYIKGYLWYQNFCKNIFSNYTNFTTNFFLILMLLHKWSQKHLVLLMRNRELQNENDQGQWNAGTLSKYTLFFLGKQALRFLLLVIKILLFSGK